MSRPQPMRWHAFGASVRGAAHRRKELPNQDSLGWWPETSFGPLMILAVADGHGSARSFRSDKGSLLAVRGALSVGWDLLEDQEYADPNLSTIKRAGEEKMPRSLVIRWKDSVDRDLETRPLTLTELEALERTDGPRARKSVEENPHVAYGSTLLTVILTDKYMMALQLGDGDIVTVSQEGELSHPLPPDARLLANETTSLCSDRAWDDFRFGFQVLGDRPPALLLVATDGLSNSYRSPEGFLQFGTELSAMIRAEGLQAVEPQIPQWLEEATVRGSGDDITLGLAVREPMPRERWRILKTPARGAVLPPRLGERWWTG